MKLQLLQDPNNHGPPPPIYFNPDIAIRNKPNKKKDSLKVKIKTQPVEAKKKMVLLYTSTFKTVSAKASLKLPVNMENILKG